MKIPCRSETGRERERERRREREKERERERTIYAWLFDYIDYLLAESLSCVCA